MKKINIFIRHIIKTMVWGGGSLAIMLIFSIFYEGISPKELLTISKDDNLISVLFGLYMLGLVSRGLVYILMHSIKALPNDIKQAKDSMNTLTKSSKTKEENDGQR